MTYSVIEFWEIMLDITGFCVCILTVLYLITNKFQHKGSISTHNDNTNGGVNKKPKAFFELMEKKIKDVDLFQNPYHEVTQYAGLGMSVKEISEQLLIPACEVELAIKLKSRYCESY